MNRKLQKTLFCLFLIIFSTVLSFSQSFSGKDFWFGFNANGINTETTSKPDQSYRVEVATAENATVVVSVPAKAFQTTINVLANSIGTVIIPNQHVYINDKLSSDKVQSTAVHVTSNVDVTVYAGNLQNFSSDYATLIPTPSLDKYYRVQAFGDIALTNPSNFCVVATKNNTTITITLPPAQESVNQNAGTSKIIVLNAGELYYVESSGLLYFLTGDRMADLTGTIVQADKPVSVYAGNVCAIVGNCLACDHIYEQVRPINTWSTQYYLAATKKTSVSADRIRIYFSEATTNYTINGVPSVNFGANTFTEIDALDNTGYVITSDQPINLSQFLRGASCSAPPIFIDPLFMDIIPEFQFGDDYVFATSSFNRYAEHYATVIIRTDQANTLELNGLPLAADLPGFLQIGTSDYSFGYITLNAGSTYKILSTNGTGFGLWVYGYGQEEAYGYTAGGQLQDLCEMITEDLSICEGDSALLKANSLHGLDFGFEWYDVQNGGSPISTLDSIFVKPITNKKYYVQPAVGVCDASRYVYNITVNKLQTGNFLITDTACVNTNTNLVYSGSGEITDSYNWDFAGATIVSGSGQGAYSLKWSTPGMKYITSTVTRNGCEGPEFMDSIYISPIPGFSIVENDPACFGEDGSVEINNVIGNSPFQYRYNSTAYGSNNVISLVAGSYTIQVKDKFGCASSANVNLVDPEKLIIDSAFADASTCGNTDGEIRFYVSGGTGTLIYTLNGSTPKASGIYSNLASDVYDLSVSDVNTCLLDTQIAVQNQDGPTLSASANLTELICFGDSTSIITAVGSGIGILTYTYKTESNLTGEFNNIPAGSHQVKVEDGNGCPNFTSVIITQPEAIVATVSNLIAGTCNLANGEVTINATGGSNVYQYSIDTGFSYQNTNLFVSLAQGTHLIIIKDDNDCLGEIEFEMGNTGIPPTLIAVSDEELCFGESTNLIANNNDLTFSYSWSPNSLVSNPTGPSTGITPIETTTVWLYVTDENSCVDSNSVEIVVNDLPIANAGNDKSFCFGLSVQLNGSGSSIGTITSFNWTPDQNIDGITSSSPTVDPDLSRVYELIVADDNGCTSLPNEIAVTVNQLPTIIAGGPESVCIGDTVQLSGEGGVSYLWSPENLLVDVKTTKNPRGLVTTDETEFTLIGTDINGCSDTSKVTVGLKLNPDASFRYLKFTNLNVRFIADTIPTNITSVEWDFGDRSPYSTNSNVKHEYAQEGKFTVRLVVFNECGSDTLFFEINIDGEVGSGDVNGVGERLNVGKVSIYPNPFNNQLNIKFDAGNEIGLNTNVKIYSITGVLIKNFRLNGESTIALDGLPKGMYHLSLSLGNKVFLNEKIVKQ